MAEPGHVYTQQSYLIKNFCPSVPHLSLFACVCVETVRMHMVRSIGVLHQSHSWEVGWLVGLIWLDDLTGAQLFVGVGWVDDELPVVVHDGESCEAVVRSELSRPASANGVDAADIASRVGLRCRRTLHLESARSCGARAWVDAEGPRASARGADSLHVLDGPLRCGCHH